MSDIEYNDLLFEISERLDELNVQERLIFMCRGKLSSGSEDSIQDALSLFQELEERDCLGPDRLEIVKDVLKRLKEWVLFGKVKTFQSKRKEYIGLLEHIIAVLDELNDLERLISICRGKIPGANEGNINDVRSLFKELENHNCLGIDYLGILKEILTQTEQSDLLKEVDKFEERRNQEDEFQTRIAQASAFVSSVGNTLIGVLNIKTVFKMVAGGIITASSLEVLSRGSSFDQLINAVERCVLPGGTKLIQITEGCVCLTIQAENLSALNTLWSLYQDGILKARLQTFFVTDELRELAGGEEVEAIVTIDEEEYEKARLEFTRKAQDADSQQREILDREGRQERPFQLETPALNEAKYLDQEKLAFVYDYLEKAEDARSMTTETSDSGMQAAQSEVAAEETSDATYKPCLKDLSEEMAAEVMGRLRGDPVTEEQFCYSFGLDLKKMPDPELFMPNITYLFPDTPVNLLKEVFEALNLYDLVELLEKVKPRTLRPAFPLKEIGKLPNAVSRSTTCYSKLEVLIIDSGTTSADDDAERIESFFKALNPQSQVMTITAAPLAEKLKGLNELKRIKEEEENRDQQYELREKRFRKQLEEAKSRSRQVQQEARTLPDHIRQGKLKRCTELESMYERSLETVIKEREQWMKERIPDVEKEIKQKEKELQDSHDYKDFQTGLFAIGNRWMQKEDTESTLFAVFEICHGTDRYLDKVQDKSGRYLTLHDGSFRHLYLPDGSGGYFEKVHDGSIGECVARMLEIIPDAAKIVMTRSHSNQVGEISEALHVVYKTRSDTFLSSVLDVLSKRWKTLDLISMMQEVQRNLNCKKKYWGRKEGKYMIELKDSLSTIPRLQKTEES